MSVNLFTAIRNVLYDFQGVQKFSKTTDCNAKFCLLDICNQVNIFLSSVDVFLLREIIG